MPTRDNLVAARALIDTPEKWLPGWMLGPTEGKYAIDQAIRAASLNEGDLLGSMAAMCAALDDAVPADFVLNEHSGLREYIQYVDAYEPTHADIMALFDRAISQQEPKP